MNKQAERAAFCSAEKFLGDAKHYTKSGVWTQIAIALSRSSGSMRIVHVVRQFRPGIGGLENMVGDLAAAQADRGHTVRVVTLNRLFDSPPGERLVPRETMAGVEVVRIPYFGSRRYPIAVSVIKHLKDADIVHVHGLDFFFDYLALTALWHRRKLVVSTHGAFFHTPYAAALKRIYFATMTRLSLSQYAGVATVGIEDDRLFNTIRSRGILLIENGVDIDKYSDASARTPARTIVSIGRFSSNKRFDRMISFAAALRRRDPRWRLSIVGRPWDLSVRDLNRLAESAGAADAVRIFATPSNDAVRDIMAHSSVIASASDYEGFGLAAVEGMSAGLYPVLSDIPPFRRLVERSGLGVLLDFSNADAAADRFLAKWQDVEADWDTTRQAAMTAGSQYSWSRVSEKYESLYHSVLGTKVRSILDVGVEVTTFPHAVDVLDTRFRRAEPAVVTFANAHTLNTLRSDRHVQALMRKSIVFNDGVGVDIASRLLFGKRFPENMNGTDFVPRYLKHSRHRYRIFFLGAKPGIAKRAAEGFSKAVPQHEIAGTHDGYFAPDDTARVVASIRNSRADILLVAMGNPKQELWLTDHLEQTGCMLGFGVGGLFDFTAGVVPRAPHWVRSARIEWLYRMLQEPRRLWRRYLLGMPVFLFRVAGQWFAGARVSRVTQE
jgi:alpha-1,3-mannosyltransferase